MNGVCLQQLRGTAPVGVQQRWWEPGSSKSGAPADAVRTVGDRGWGVATQWQCWRQGGEWQPPTGATDCQCVFSQGVHHHTLGVHVHPCVLPTRCPWARLFFSQSRTTSSTGSRTKLYGFRSIPKNHYEPRISDMEN